MAINIYDIAREANTSISTVSRYLNHKNVRPATKERIEKVISKYNFKPNAIAQGLVTKSTNTIAVMVVDIRLQHYADAAYVIDRELSSLGYRTVICNTAGDIDLCLEYIDSVLSISIDGIIFIGSFFNVLNEYPEALAKLNDLPVAITNGNLNVSKCSPIFIDEKGGVYDATKYLIEKGRKNIAYIQYLSNSSALNKRDGYLKAMEEAGLEPHVHLTDDIFEGGYDVTLDIVSKHPELDAVISGEDVISVGAVRALTISHKKVGEDVLVIGFNDGYFSNLCVPALTSVNNKVKESSLEAVKRLEAILAGNSKEELINIKCELNIKESA